MVISQTFATMGLLTGLVTLSANYATRKRATRLVKSAKACLRTAHRHCSLRRKRISMGEETINPMSWTPWPGIWP